MYVVASIVNSLVLAKNGYKLFTSSKQCSLSHLGYALMSSCLALSLNDEGFH